MDTNATKVAIQEAYDEAVTKEGHEVDWVTGRTGEAFTDAYDLGRLEVVIIYDIDMPPGGPFMDLALHRGAWTLVCVQHKDRGFRDQRAREGIGYKDYDLQGLIDGVSTSASIYEAFLADSQLQGRTGRNPEAPVFVDDNGVEYNINPYGSRNWVSVYSKASAYDQDLVDHALEIIREASGKEVRYGNFPPNGDTPESHPETSLTVWGDIIQAMYDIASETPGHDVVWVRDGIEFRDSFTHMGMNIQVKYTIDDILSVFIKEDPMVTKIKVTHPDLNLKREWSRSGLGYPNSTLDTLCEALRARADLYQAVKEAEFMVACNGNSLVVMGSRSEMYDLTITPEAIEVTPDEESFTVAGVREVDKPLLTYLGQALHKYASEHNRSSVYVRRNVFA